MLILLKVPVNLMKSSTLLQIAIFSDSGIMCSYCVLSFWSTSAYRQYET